MHLPVLFSRAIASTMIMVPMYIYPTSTAWDPILQSIAYNPETQFQLIINPNSGPGAAPYPNVDYVSAIKKARSFPNAKLLGYVHTSYAGRPVADVQDEIKIYAGWKSYTGGDIHMDGIFFDEAPSTWAAATTGAYMTNITNFARINFTSITFNPGTITDAQFFPLADNVVVFENAASQWTPNINALNRTTSAQKAKSVVMIYNYKGKGVDQYAIAQTVTGMGMAGLFLSNVNGYSAVSTIWKSFCVLVGLSNSGL